MKILVLFAVALALLATTTARRRPSYRSDSEEESDFEGPGIESIQDLFQPGTEYTFDYDAQIASGYAPWISAQRSMSRLQCKVRITVNNGNGVLRMDNVRSGQLNNEPRNQSRGDFFDYTAIQDFRIFNKADREDKQRVNSKLELPLEFNYKNGLVSNIQFHEDDQPWSKNIKKAVLSLVQLNTSPETQYNPESQDQDQEQDEQGSQEQKKQKRRTRPASLQQSYITMEDSLEGMCQTLYSVMVSESKYDRRQNTVDVTKTFDFDRCKMLADVSYGYQVEPIQHQSYLEQHLYNDPTQQKNTGTLIPKEKLDRSTTIRMTLSQSAQNKKRQNNQESNQPKYGIKNVELVSKYVMKSSRAESSQAMQTVAVAQLSFDNAKTAQPEDTQIDVTKSHAESLMYNADMESLEKEYFMRGDESSVNVFNVWKRERKTEVSKAADHLMKLVKIYGVNNKENGGISARSAEVFARLVEIMRMCPVEELKEIEQKTQQVIGEEKKHGALSQEQKQKLAADLFADGLATAATRNTIFLIKEKIQENDKENRINEAKAIQLLKTLGRGAGLPAPSDAQADIILSLCQSENVKKSEALRQSCWLTFGSMVGEVVLQSHKMKLMGITSTPMKQYEICPQNKIDLYASTLTENLRNAEDMYEKILAIKCLGNAGIISTIPNLREVFANKAESHIVRINAIDALRRLKHQLPAQTIQSQVLSLYTNADEESEVRMAALSLLMHTRPTRTVADQIAMAMSREKSSEVQAFAYSHVKSISESPMPEDKKCAEDLRNALKLAGVDEEMMEHKHALGTSKRGRKAFYSHQQQEGVFIDWSQVFSDSSELPSHLSFGLDTFFNDQFNKDALKLSLCQKDMEKIALRVMGGKRQRELEDDEEQSENQEQDNQNDKEQQKEEGFFSKAANKLKSIFGGLKIKERKQNKVTQKTGPYMFATIRLNNVDLAILPLYSPSQQPATVSQIAHKIKQYITGFFHHSSTFDGQIKLNSAIVLNARKSAVPTSLGLTLRMSQSMYLMGQIKASVKSAQGGRVEIKAHPNFNWVQTQKMETQALFYSSGVRSTRAVEANLPIDMSFKPTNSRDTSKQSIEASFKVPDSHIRVLGVHTLATTFLKGRNEFESNDTSLPHYFRIKTVHNERLQHQQREVNFKAGEHNFFGLPVNVKGHFQKPRQYSLKEIMEVIMSGDNNVRVEFDPSATNRKEFEVTLSHDLDVNSPSRPASSIRPRIQDFYRAAAQGEGLVFETRQRGDNDESNSMEAEREQFVDNAQEQERKFDQYLEKNGKSQRDNYKHTLKATVKTIGSDQQSHASLEVDSVCDRRLRACESNINIRRNRLQHEKSEWAFQSQIQTLYPEYVSDLEEFVEASDNGKRQQKFFAHIEAEWGTEGQKQKIQLNAEGEPSQNMITQARQRTQNFRQEQRKSRGRYPCRGCSGKNTLNNSPRNAPFLDKYTMVAQYRLSPSSQRFFQRGLELVKSAHFWNTQSRMSQQSQQNAVARRGQQINDGQMSATMNIDMMTHSYANVSIMTPSQQVSIHTMELPVRLQPMKLVRPITTHRPAKPFTDFIAKKNRAQCRVGVNTVDTFDGVALKAPLSSCYTVLAKDCATRSQPKFAVLMKSLDSESDQKKIKILTRNKEVEVTPEGDSVLKIKLNENVYTVENGQISRQSDEDKLRADGIEVETDSRDRQAVIVDMGKLSVKFNGRQAKIQLSDDFKNLQCGLCGNFNEDSEDELRKNDDELTNDVQDFHRSYTVQDEDCDEKEHKRFYDTQNKHHFENSREQQQVSPTSQTMIMEYNQKMCFSQKTVKQCPKGYVSADDDEPDTQLLKREKVVFSCLDRYSIEAKRLKSEVRRSGKADISDYPTSFVEAVIIPQRCIAY